MLGLAPLSGAPLSALPSSSGASPHVTVGLTGQSLPYSYGSISPSNSGSSNVTVGVSGQSVTFTAGPLLTPGRSAPLVGLPYSCVPGTVGVAMPRSVVGAPYALTPGAFLSVQRQTPQLPQLVMSYYMSLPGVSKTVGLTGTSIAYLQGMPTVGGDRAAALTGQTATYSTGALGRETSVVVPGQSLSHAQGSVGIPPPHNPYTRLLLKFDETAGTTNVTDMSVFRHTATFTGDSVTSAQGMFGTNSAAVGNPGGTFAASSVEVDDPNGVFADGIVPRQFDLWYRLWGYPISQGNQPLLFIKFANGNTIVLYLQGTSHLNAYFNGTRSVSINAPVSMPVNTWRHFRLLIDGHTVRIGLNGAEVGSATIANDAWTGGDSNLPIEIRFGSAYDGVYNSQGYFDAIEFTEGTVEWTGGAYTIPTREPSDGYPLPPIEGTSSVVLEDCPTAWQVVAQDVLNGVGANTTEDCLGSGDAVHDAHFAEGANTLDDCLGDGYASEGVVRFADGAVVTENVQSLGILVATPISKGVGAATTISVTSVGDGGVGWAVGEGVTTLEDAVSVGVGTVSAFATSTGVGANTTSVSSIGVGQVAVQGAGANTVTVSSAGTIKDEQFGAGANMVSVVGAGVASAYTPLWGEAMLQDVVSIGAGYGTLFAAGGAAISVTSVGQGVVPIVGVGWGSTEVFTVDLDGWEPSTSAIYLHVGADVLSLYAQDSVMVTT